MLQVKHFKPSEHFFFTFTLKTGSMMSQYVSNNQHKSFATTDHNMKMFSKIEPFLQISLLKN